MTALVNTAGQPLKSDVTGPDQSFFLDLNSQVQDKGFLVTSTEDLFQ